MKRIICYFKGHEWSEDLDHRIRFPRLIDQTPWVCDRCNQVRPDYINKISMPTLRRYAFFIIWSAAMILLIANSIQHAKFNYSPTEAGFDKFVADHPSASCHRAGGQWGLSSNNTDFTTGTSINTYKCRITHDVSEDWFIQ